MPSRPQLTHVKGVEQHMGWDPKIPSLSGVIPNQWDSQRCGCMRRSVSHRHIQVLHRRGKSTSVPGAATRVSYRTAFDCHSVSGKARSALLAAAIYKISTIRKLQIDISHAPRFEAGKALSSPASPDLPDMPDLARLARPGSALFDILDQLPARNCTWMTPQPPACAFLIYFDRTCQRG